MLDSTVYYGDHNWQELIALTPRPETEDGGPQILPRATRYGSKEAEFCGLIPVEAELEIPAWADMKELIAWAHANKIFPVYHQQNTWIPTDGKPWNQNGLPWCWIWGLTGCCMDVEARMGRRKKGDPRLAPTSGGGAVNWQSRGYYLDGAIAHVTKYGLCEETFCLNEHSRSQSNYREGWRENALLHRPMEWWDTDCRQGDQYTARQAMAIFMQASSCYIAHNWWGHALGLVAFEWDESQPNNLVWVHRNSHREVLPIKLTGSKGSPDEIYGIRAMY